mmetsp:Transcript_52997/g.103671  ORF Transcript_52997/g.103671 Transcript_52997/m.103671 type:complete len:83 (-) Transcript_52997:175-423(-)
MRVKCVSEHMKEGAGRLTASSTVLLLLDLDGGVSVFEGPESVDQVLFIHSSSACLRVLAWVLTDHRSLSSLRAVIAMLCVHV